MIPSYYDAPTHEGSLSMRGDDQQTGYLFSYLSPDDRVPPDHPLRPIRQMTDTVLARLSTRFDRLLLRHRSAVGPARAIAPGVVAAGAVHRTQRTAADGATAVQLVVPLVRRPEYG